MSTETARSSRYATGSWPLCSAPCRVGREPATGGVATAAADQATETSAGRSSPDSVYLGALRTVGERWAVGTKTLKMKLGVSYRFAEVILWPTFMATTRLAAGNVVSPERFVECLCC